MGSVYTNELLTELIAIYIISLIVIKILKEVRIELMKLIRGKEIPNKLNYYRVYVGKTQNEMAEILNISLPLYRKIEVNHKYPGIMTRRKILNYFNVSENQMFN